MQKVVVQMLVYYQIHHFPYCRVDAHANVCALFLIRRWICVDLRRNRSRSSGAVLGVAVCAHVLYTGLYSRLVSSLGSDPFTVLFSHVVES